jgi:hypothetical protein
MHGFFIIFFIIIRAPASVMHSNSAASILSANKNRGIPK